MSRSDRDERDDRDRPAKKGDKKPAVIELNQNHGLTAGEAFLRRLLPADVAAYRAELFAWVEAQEKAKLTMSSSGFYMGVPRVHWLLSENNAVAALPLLEPLDKMPVMEILLVAQQLPNTHQTEAVRLFKFALDKKMSNASSPYQAELRLVREIAMRLPQIERVLWLDGIRKTYKAKRNFIKGLNEMTLPT